MEQLYMIEIFIDQLSVLLEEDEKIDKKRYIIKINFGSTQMLIKEDQLTKNNNEAEDSYDCDKDGKRRCTRKLRVGKSYLFFSYPEMMFLELTRYPLLIEVWNDDKTEDPIYVGTGQMYWTPEFFFKAEDTSIPCAVINPITLKVVETLWAECCCKKCGEISFILRFSSFGDSIKTEFQQLLTTPDIFYYRTDKAPSKFQVKKVDGDSPRYCTIGDFYRLATSEDPKTKVDASRKIDICTQLKSCGLKGVDGKERRCEHAMQMEKIKKEYPVDKFKMGEVRGPCGNTNCSLAHKIRNYIRNLDTYKAVGESRKGVPKSNVQTTVKVCGKCVCRDDAWHRGKCEEKKKTKDDNLKIACDQCGGLTPADDACKDRVKKYFGTGATPPDGRSTPTNVFYNTLYDHFPSHTATGKINYKVQSVFVENEWPLRRMKDKNGNTINSGASSCINLSINISGLGMLRESYSYDNITSHPSNKTIEIDNDQSVNYASHLSEFSEKDQIANFDSFSSKFAINRDRTYQVYNFCTDIPDDKDCHCNPPVPPVPCKTFNCDCIAEIGRKMSRKIHKPYCPSYSHKPNCPVNLTHEDEDENKEEEEEVVPLPYGLPPVKLGPCPILGKPCTYPDGFSRMYKVGAMANQPQSYSDAGKVCCSKEYERIKKAIQEYMQKPKGHDERCKNKYIIDTETRCCDHEQRLFSLQGKECCGRHKMELKDLYMKKDKEKS